MMIEREGVMAAREPGFQKRGARLEKSCTTSCKRQRSCVRSYLLRSTKQKILILFFSTFFDFLFQTKRNETCLDYTVRVRGGPRGGR